MDSTVSGFAPRASRYFIIISMFIIQAAAQIPPGAPSITGPQVIIKDDQVTLTCTVIGGSPTPTVKWLRDDTVIDDSSTTSGNQVVNTYSFTASSREHLEVFECQSENGVLQNPLSRTKFVEVYRPPITPVLVGPTDIQPGTLTTWTCTSEGGYPLQTMAMRIGNSVFSTELTTNSALVSESYTVTGTLSWAPTTANNGQTLFCDVYHPETLGQNNPQTVSKLLTVKSPLAVNAPRTLYEPTTGQTITLTCQVTSGTATSITWYKDNQLLNLAANSRLSGASPGAPSMTISNVQTSDTGNYICSATDGSATRNTSTITVSPRATPTQPTLVGPTSMTAGSTGTWTCTSIGGFPLQTMSMRINNVVVNSNELSINSQYNSNLRTYTVVGTLNKALNMGNNGQTLFCDVTHPQTLQSPQTVSLPLTVRSPLAVNAPRTLYDPTTGQTIELTCRVTSGTATGISWYKNNQLVVLAFNNRYSGGSAQSPSLTISNVQLSDAGNYICSATDGSVTRNTSTITVSPKATPTQPTLNGPSSLLSGSTGTWTCTSIGGFPLQTMSMRINNQVFASNFLSINSQYDTNSRSYRVVGTLNWAPNMGHNGQTMYCDVTHPQTLTSPQTVSLPLTVRSPLAVNAPKTLYDPSTGQTIELTCVVTSGSATGITWYKNNQPVIISFNNRYSAGSVQTPSLTISNVQLSDAGNYVCSATDGSVTVNTNTITVSPKATPTQPTLTGSTSLLSGTTGTWTCTSIGGFPLQTMSMRINNQVFTSNYLSVTSQYDTNARSYRVVGTLNWAPNMGHNGQTMYCDVTHPQTLNSPQTVSLPLTVRSPLAVNAPQNLYEPTTGQTVILQCRVTAGTATGITWYKNGQMVIKASDFRLSGAVPSSPSLTISNVRLSDTGNYICSATDGSVTRNTSTITVTAKATPSQPTLTGPTALTSGTPGTWTCTSIGAFPAQSMSMRIGNQVFSAELSVNTQFDSNARSYTAVGTLNWSPTMINNGQTIFCDVTHPDTLNGPQTVSLPLTVRSPLAVNAPTTFYNPMEDESVTLTCIVTSGTATGIKWYKNTAQINIAANPRISGSMANSPSITITDIVLADGGSYVCEATDGFATVSTNTITVTVREKPWLEYDIITYVLDGYNKLVRPVDPVNNLTHSLIPQQIFEFDGKKLVLQSQQCMNWNDPRLTWPKGQPRISLPSSEIWIPDIVLLGHKYEPDFHTKVIVMKNGDVTYCPQGPLISTDCQEKSGEVYECTFKFLSWSYDKVMLDKYFPGFASRPSIDMSIYYEHDDYEIVSRCAVRREMTYPCRDGTYPELTYSFVLRRRRSFCRNLNQSPTCN
ncbi:titin-like isoform X6 [Mytilus californianus]|uniref:titin-like isoform X6 n=1 Tax=Mytilus californianus TaxID=6549 RepID=UPI002245374F|nr:titin-like isoform X6 [Mytilus californianus]